LFDANMQKIAPKILTNRVKTSNEQIGIKIVVKLDEEGESGWLGISGPKGTFIALPVPESIGTN